MANRRAAAPEEALKFVTLNPAKQLRIDHLVGSIAEGKHADLALWSGPPLALTSVCEQTWIDGRKFSTVKTIGVSGQNKTSSVGN